MTCDDKKTITIESGAGRIGKEVLNLADWKTKSRNYFNRYYKASNIISAPTDMDMIMSTLYEVFLYNRGRGFLIKDYDIAKHLDFLGYDKDNLKTKLKIKLKNIIIPYLVYIERKRVVLICDKIVSCSNKRQCMDNVAASMKCFLTLFSNDIQSTDVTVIGLLIRENDKVDELIKCNFCKLFSPSFKVFKSLASCIKWWNSVETYTNKWWDLSKPTKTNELFEHLVAEILPFMALQKKHNNLPSITNNICQQFEQTYLLFTPQQMDIYLSDAKHIVIQGSYGSGKSILGLKKLEMIARNKSTQYQKIIYINFDSKCELHIKMEIDVRKYARIPSRKIKLTDSIQEIFKSPDALINVFHNSAGENLSTILQDIIKHQKMGTSEKLEIDVHVIIEEYDGESLTHIEAVQITNLIKDNFKKSYVIILAQPLKKKRSWNAGEESYEKETCMFQELKSAFKIVKLQKVLRSSNEITQITKSAQKFVRNKDSIYITEMDGKKFEQKQRSADIKQYPASYSAQTSNDPEKTLNYKNNINSTYSNSSVKSNKRHDDAMDLDQALELTSSLENGTGKNIIKSSFSFICEPRKGVEIKGVKPKLYEFSGDIHSASDMAVISLALVLADITNENKKTVLLHMSEEKPDILGKAIQLLPMLLDNAFFTESIKEYIRNDRPGNTILSSSFRRVNGMEFDHVVIFVSYLEYYLKYYLPQVISRCTYDLNFIFLPKENQTSENDKLIDSEETVVGLLEEIKQKCSVIQLDIVECQTCEEDDEILVDCISGETDKKLFRVHTHSEQYNEYADQYNECLPEVTKNKESREQSADSSARAKAR